MQKEKLGYKVFVWGESMQIIEVVLDPGKTIPAGTIFSNWIEGGITSKTQADQRVNPDQGVFGRLLDSGKKKLGRIHYPVTYFTNPSNTRKSVAFAAPNERQILPVHLTDKDGNFFCHKEAFICTDSGIEVISESSSPLKSNFLGLEKSDWLEFRGNGIIFVHVGGSFKNKQLKNQNLKLDRRSIVGFTAGINYDRRIAGVNVLNRSDTKTYFHAKLSGSGTVYLQTKPFKIPKHAQSLTHDIRELANTKAIQLYKGNLEKIKSFQWSTLQDRIKTENLKNTLKKKIVISGRSIKLTDKNS
jgi:uncharacterized protein (AIM24 family)